MIPLALLGIAHAHAGMYCRRWLDQPELGVRPAAVWDHDRPRAEKARQDFGCEVLDSPQCLLSRPDLPAVLIASETSLHADLCEKAAAAGKAIVLQKPISLTLAEADRIVAAVERAGVRFTLCWQMRVDPQNLEIKRLVDTRALGRLFMVRRRHGLPTHQWAGFEDSWHVQPGLNRDIWADDAAHPIDFLYWLLGEPESVAAEIESLYNPKIPMDNGVAIFRYPGGPVAEISCSFTCGAGENTTEISGERGAIVQNFGDVPSCNIPRPPGAIGLKWFLAESGQWGISDIPSPATHQERIAALARPIAEFLRGNRPPIATAREGRAVLRMALATRLSARLGRRVKLDEVEGEA